ncbi:MAG: metallophosphoesterase family protein [Casimicrobiaceae bacterium]
MRRVMHLSDLHFGRTNSAVVLGLREIAQQLDPHLVVVSGDLTQRARKREFIAARAFLDSLAVPTIVVPGNHDVPLYNVVARFLAPLDRYRRFLAPEVEPAFVDDEMVVVGVNTARSLTFKGGRINREQVERATELFCGMPSERVRILVTHHPFDLPGTRSPHDLVGRAAMAMSSLRECAPDLLLAGHLHRPGIGTTAERHDFDGHSAIVVQAGTATSTRGRGARNSFNLIHVDRCDIAIDRFDWLPMQKAFELDSTCRFSRRDGAWVPAGDAGA